MKFTKLFVLFSLFFVAILLLPKLAMADSTYQIKFFNDSNGNGVMDGIGDNKEIFAVGGTPSVEVCYEGFVPCGKYLVEGSVVDGKCPKGTKETKELVHCQLCHSFIMIDKAVDYVVVKLVPLLAVLMLVIGGVMFYFGGVRPELLSRAKTLIKGVVIGLVIIYSAYLIVNIFLTVLGAAKINTVSDVFKDGVFSVECPIIAPVPKGGVVNFWK